MIFNELDHRLSIVPRWTIVRTIQKQSVAEHCFNVERIATQIAIKWMGIREIELLFGISQYALHHDDDEALTGDIPSTAKGYVQINLVSESHKWAHGNDTVIHVVKLADLLEAVWFLSIESKLGNLYNEQHFRRCGEKVILYADQHFDADITNKCNELMKQWQVEESDGFE